MTEVTAGSSITLLVTFYEFSGGPTQDVTGLTIKVVKASDASVILGPTSTGVTRLSQGLYAYTWATSDSLVAGDYVAVWDATDQSSDAVETSEVITVVVSSTGTWATTDDVLNITGITVGAATLRMAQNIIELFCGTTYDATTNDNLSTKNTRLLKQAVSYQAAFMAPKPDMFTRMDISSFSQDGMSAQMNNDNANLLSPLARRCIARLSWKKDGLRVGKRQGITRPLRTSDSATTDDYEDWVQIGQSSTGAVTSSGDWRDLS